MNYGRPINLRMLVVQKTFELEKPVMQRDGAIYVDGQLLMSADDVSALLHQNRVFVARVVARETWKRFVMAVAVTIFGVAMMGVFVGIHGYFPWPMLVIELVVLAMLYICRWQLRTARALCAKLEKDAPPS